MFKHEFVANLSLRPLAKNVENRLISGEVMGRSLVACFLTYSVVVRSSAFHCAAV